MSTADGKIRFSTEIDNSKMEKALSSILKTIQAFSGDSSKAFKKIDESADDISNTMAKAADTINQISAGDMEKLIKHWDNLNAQIEVQKSCWIPSAKNMKEWQILKDQTAKRL